MRNTDFGLGHNLRIRFGETYVPGKHVAIIYTYGHFNRIIGPGYHRLKSYSESCQGLVDISGKSLSFTVDNLRSIECIPVSVEGTVIFRLNPFYFEGIQNGKEQLANFIEMNRSAHKASVSRQVTICIRSILGSFSYADLGNGANLNLFQETIGEVLAEMLSKQGYQLVGQVVLDYILLPHSMELSQVLQTIPQNLYAPLSRAQFFDRLHEVRGNISIFTDFDTMPHPDPDARRTQYQSNGRSPQPSRPNNNQAPYLNQ